MDAVGQPLALSNYGEAYRAQGLLAPGDRILGALPGGGTDLRRGTSYAAPFVTGHAALLAGLQMAHGRPPDPAAIRKALLDSAAPCPDETESDCQRFLAGRIDVNAAINLIRGGIVMTEGFQHPVADFRAEPATELQPQDATQPMPAAWTLPASASSGAAVIRPSGEAIPDEPSAGILAADGPVVPSDCGCGCGGKKEKPAGADCGCGCGGAKAGGAPAKPQLVYALGKLGYDFGSEARRDSLTQAMAGNANNPLLPDQWLGYLEANPFDASSVIWTLNLDATPIYAIQPVGPFAASGYERLREALRAQLHEGVELISVPGVIGGSVRLQSGQVVPVIVPAIRGMYSWATKPLVIHVLGAAPKAASEKDVYERFSAGLTNFLDRVYYDLRNLGITGEERALNYSATNAVQIADVIRSTTRDQLDLDRLAVKKSPVCRPDSECYDVELSFFNPNNTNIANRVYRFTVDVSDVIPVTVGTVRSWTRRA
jgi:cyanobactin maturation PatA/PatG family protease